MKFKDVDVEISGSWEVDEDDEDDSDFGDDSADSSDESSYQASLDASIIARRLYIDRHSHIIVRGNAIPARRPQIKLAEEVDSFGSTVHGADSAWCRQYMVQTVHGADSTWCRQYMVQAFLAAEKRNQKV